MSDSVVAPASAVFPLTGQLALSHLGVIRAEGEDAAKFLHGQLTQDFSLLGPTEARLAALCSPQGRMLGSFVGFKRNPDDILLLVPRDILPAMLKRLGMFVLRAKVKLSDATAQFALVGEVQPAGGQPATPWRVTSPSAEVTRIELYPAMGNRRFIHVQPAGQGNCDEGGLDESLWQWLEVRSGVGLIGEPLTGALVPQMLNYESVGGVSFKKGCYPGQEVVARSQYRGTLKRRGYVVSGDGPLQSGQDIFQASDPEQPCGVVAAAAANPGGGFDALVSLQIASVDGELRAGSASGPRLALLPLPYVLRDDI